MEVLYLGYPRTGTPSIVEALATQDYATLDYFHRLFANVRDADLW
jgi:hypothetical protein